MPENIQLLIAPYYDFPFKLEDHVVGVKTSKTWSKRLSSMHVFKDTEDNRQKANNANSILKQIETLQTMRSNIIRSMEKYVE